MGTALPTQLGEIDCAVVETHADDPSSLGATQPQNKTYTLGGVSFEVDTRFVPVGKASGFMHFSFLATNTQTGQKLVIQKVELKSFTGDVFYGIMALRDVQESMDTDLRAVIKSQNSLSDDHIKYLMYNLREETNECINRWYDAPEEMLAPGSLDTSVDIWAAGCILAELIKREPVFPCSDHLQHLRMVFKLIGSPNDDEVRACPTQAAEFVKSICCPKADLATVFPTATTLALDLLERMLCFDPKKRITAANALMHPYFSEFAHDDTPEAGSAL
eukprot:gene23239-28125_t